MQNNEEITTTDNNRLSTAVRALVLGFFAIVLAVVAVSFAIHHMRQGFENEYYDHYQQQLEALAINATLVIDGDEIEANPVEAGQKYPAIINLMIPDQSEESFSTIDYGLFLCLDENSLAVIYMSDQNALLAPITPIYKWRSNDPESHTIVTDAKNSVFVPILNSRGETVGLFELTGTHSQLREYGNILEGKLLMAVIVSAVVGLVLFSVQYFVPKILRFRLREEVEE